MKRAGQSFSHQNVFDKRIHSKTSFSSVERRIENRGAKATQNN